MHETPLSFRRLAAFSLCTGLLAWPITAEDPTALRAVELEVCQEIVDFECQGTDRAFGPEVEIVAFLTRIDGATGTAFVEHVWTVDGKEVRRVRLPIKTSSYRTWSKKRIKGSPGKWRAEVLDPIGRSLGAVDFVVRGG